MKSEMMPAGTYDANKSGLIYMFKMSTYGAPTTDFIWEAKVSVNCFLSNIIISFK